MLRLVGYTDRLGSAPGDTIRFMVSSEHARYQARLVRLIHGDENPEGPGFKQVLVPSSFEGEYDGRHQDFPSGSSVSIPMPAGTIDGSFTFAVFLQATLPGVGEQVIASRGDASTDSGAWSLGISADGRLQGVVGDTRVVVDAPVHRWTWYLVGLTVDGDTGRVTVWQRPVREAGVEAAAAASGAFAGAIADTDDDLVLAADQGTPGQFVHHLDGRLDRPRLFGRALTDDEIERLLHEPDDLEAFEPDVIGAWDFALDIPTDRASDISGHGRHGTTRNMPTRGVSGHDHDGSETDWRRAPDQYGAIHFHRDDLEDADWDTAFTWTVPDDLPSGIYAAWLRAGDDEEYLPFIVRPPRGTTRSRIAVVMSTLTYAIYENFTDIGRDAWLEGGFSPDPVHYPFADPTIFHDVFEYIATNSLYGVYDAHEDGTGVVYGSLLRPILNTRPKFRYRSLAAPSRFAADLYLVDWLDHHGIEVDYLTDHDLIAEGTELLRPYQVVVTSSHHEYWTGPMLDALEAYLTSGGRFMYLGGNSLFGVVTVDPARPHAFEIRRWGTGWPFEAAPSDRHHSMTGELGGTWRNRGRGPHQLVGVGTAGAGFDRGSPYRRTPESHDPRVEFIFEGIEGDLIGDERNLQVRWGAGGYEFDRVDQELGSPATTIRLASTIDFNASHRSMVDDQMYFQQGRDGHHVADPQVPGEPHRFARSDMAYLEYPNGGAVFSAGAICWRASLSANDYDGTVSRVTANVLRRFADPTWRRS